MPMKRRPRKPEGRSEIMSQRSPAKKMTMAIQEKLLVLLTLVGVGTMMTARTTLINDKSIGKKKSRRCPGCKSDQGLNLPTRCSPRNKKKQLGTPRENSVVQYATF
jgi:hypothetical protein